MIRYLKLFTSMALMAGTLLSTVPAQAQTSFESAGLELGWSFDNLRKRYGKPMDEKINAGFIIVRYEIETASIGRILSDDYNITLKEIFNDNFLYLALRNDTVIASLRVIKSQNLKEIMSLYDSAVLRRIKDYGRKPDDEKSTNAFWYNRVANYEKVLVDGVIFDVESKQGPYICKFLIQDMTYPLAAKAIATSDFFR